GGVGAGEVAGIELRLRQLDAGPVETLAAAAVRLVRKGRAEHAEADLLPVDLGCQGGLEAGDLLHLATRQIPHVALTREAPELECAAISGLRGFSHPAARIERREVRVALVDGS